MRLLESLVLFRAAATLAREALGYASRLVSWAVCGATAAAALNLLRVWESAARVGTADAFFRLLLSERINVHYGDLNAAGSFIRHGPLRRHRSDDAAARTALGRFGLADRILGLANGLTRSRRCRHAGAASSGWRASVATAQQ